MPTTHNGGRAAARWAGTINLLLPGGGLILMGALWSGLLVGLVFTVCANAAVVTVLLVPDDFSAVAKALASGLAVGSYVGAQFRLLRVARDRQIQEALARRRRLLRQAQECLARGQPLAALEALEPLAAEAAHDLAVAYRLAQALTASGDLTRARAAWQQVRALDRHGVYREQVRENERRFGRVD